MIANQQRNSETNEISTTARVCIVVLLPDPDRRSRMWGGQTQRLWSHDKSAMVQTAK